MKQINLKKVCIAALVAVLTFTTLFTGMKVLADETDYTDDLTGPDYTDDLIVRKILETNVGTTVPNVTFNFQLQYVELENDTIPAVVVPGLPVGEWVTRGNVSFTSAMVPVPTLANPDIVTVTGSSEDLLAGIDWQRAGRYTFLLREQANTNTLNNTPPVTETMEYDATVFGVHVWVRPAANGDLYVEAVHVFEIDEDGDFGSKVAEEDRLFTNRFIRQFDNPTSGTGPDQRGLRVSKTVVGDASSPTTDFEFRVTLTSAAITPQGHTGTYTAIIVGPAAAPNNGTTVTFTSGVPTTFTLRYGQSLQFNNLPVGTRFNIEETEFYHYTPSIDLIVNGVPATPYGPAITGTHQIGELQNDAAFTNTFSTTPITGLIANNLPFILVGIASIGLITLVVASRKRRAYE